MKDIRSLIDVASGRKKADLVLKNANVINVFTKEILPADVAIVGGYIAGVGKYDAENTIDCTDKYLCPGFIDAHIHIESTMVVPGEFVRMALPSGTTTVIADPHEITNVCGAKGVQFMLDASENVPCNIFIMLPSGVPATPFETAGSTFTADEMLPFISHPRVLGLGEAMAFTEVIAGKGDIIDKLKLFNQKNIDGHAPGLSEHSLQAYVAPGIMTEHECTTFSEAIEKARAGLAILVREGSAAHNLSAIVNGLVDTNTPIDRFLFCTDDKHLDDLHRDGHIRWNVKLAIELGMKPVDAICMATINTARVYGLRDIGAIAAGYKADLVLLSSLKQVNVSEVYKDGIPVAKRIAEMPDFTVKDSGILKTVKTPRISAKELQLSTTGETDVIELIPYQLVTNHLREVVPQKDGFFTPDSVYTKLCVVERHGKNGNIAVAPLKGYGITNGALATSVAHDSHNIIAAGDNDEDLCIAINHLRDIDGGYVLVSNGKIIGDVPLPVAGLMSYAPAEDVQKATGDILKQANTMGIPYYVDPFISLSFMALPVIPDLRLTDLGLFDVKKFALI